MRAMIFAAGLGTRLRPLTDTMPKALVPVAGKPLLEHLILKMKAAGITDIVINVHHFADQIIHFIERNHSFGIQIRISDERSQLLETGGGIRHAIPLFESVGEERNEEPILIHNVDILSNLDFSSFCVLPPEEDALLLVSNRETARYLLFDSTNRLMGWTNVKTGEVKSPFPDLKMDACTKYAFAGIHLFSTRLFPYMDRWKEKFSIIDFYLSIADKTVIRGIPKENLQLIDVGKLDSLSEAESFMKSFSI